MDVTPLVREGLNIIQSYRGGTFVINGQSYNHAIFLTGSELLVMPDLDTSLPAISQIQPLEDKMKACDIVLMGTGETFTMPNYVLRDEYRKAGFRFDYMDTGAACRTFNVLVAEGRQAGAILIPAGVKAED